MPKRIPITAAKRIATEHGCSQVILLAWDGEQTHVVTYGKSAVDCAQAAAGGNKLKAALGWPEALCNAQPARAKRGRHRTLTDEDVAAWVRRTNFADGVSIAEARAAIDDARSMHALPPGGDA